MESTDNQGQAEPGATADAPASFWNQVVNSPPGVVQITVPQPGNLWVLFEIGDLPPLEIGIFHQGGATSPISPGENFVPVGTGDFLFYQLVNPATDSIKLAYQMV